MSRRYKEPGPIFKKLWASTSLSREATVPISDYDVEVEKEPDEDGLVLVNKTYDFSNCNLEEAFLENYHSVEEILKGIQELAKSVNKEGLTDENLKTLNILARASTGWNVDEFEVVLGK